MEEKQIIDKILKARENRFKIREGYVRRDLATLSLTLNIPGYPKHNQLTEQCFQFVLDDLKNYLLANRIFIEKEEEYNQIDEAGRFFLTSLTHGIKEVEQIKLKTEEFENSHELGRIIDVDIFDKFGKPVSSGKQKTCIICSDKPAILCMREKTHSYDELRSFIFDKIWSFNFEQRNQKIKQKLSEIATKSILLEVSLTPKPGLVDFRDSGAHTDMNFHVFMASSAAISQFWSEFAEAGLNFDENLQDALPIVRQIGLKAERAMFKATNGINTQKGLIFLLGLSVFTTGYFFKTTDNFDEKTFIEVLKEICFKLVENELISVENKRSHGEKTFEKYGLKGAGARLQAEKGFPLVFNQILPFLRENLNNDLLMDTDKTNDVFKTALVKIINKLDDSNVLYRKGLITAENLKKLAGKVIKGKKTYKELCDFCLNENISPGGAADILAVSLFFYFVEID
ncbi:MAG: triphosphoribosyl-dephospho-CoA synthase [Bacteroidales bacterium]|nr:triphosphoribosyl-dephospho-CoA synthase [Bacteroidales bacterium]